MVTRRYSLDSNLGPEIMRMTAAKIAARAGEGQLTLSSKDKMKGGAEQVSKALRWQVAGCQTQSRLVVKI